MGDRLHEAGAEGREEDRVFQPEAAGQRLLDVIARDPWQTPPPFEKLVEDLAGAYSRRINIQHRFVFQVYNAERAIKVIRMWTHYE